jgi:hypothetical protein
MWRRLLLLWTASRVVTLALGVLLTVTLGWRRELEPWQSQPWLALTGWDTEYYVRLSHTWYHPGLDVAFYPLYPALIEAFRFVTHLDDAVVALIVANVATLLALGGLYVLARDRLSDAHARRAVLYLLISPYAFALVLAYSEGVFLALVTWAFVCSDRGRDWRVVPLAFAASLTRVSGLALVLPLALVAWHRRSVAAWTAAAAPLIAFALHAGILRHATGDPLAMVHVQRNWGAHASSPLSSFTDQFTRFASTHDVFYLVRGVTLVAYLLLLIPIVRCRLFAARRAEDLLYVGGIFALPLLSGVLQSIGRFGLVAFPLFYALADIGLRRRWLHEAYIVFGPVFQAIFFTAVALGYRPP